MELISNGDMGACLEGAKQQWKHGCMLHINEDIDGR